VDWRWSETEPGKVVLDDYDRIYAALVARGIRPIMIPMYAPSWAIDPSTPCDQWATDCRFAPAPEHVEDYAEFCALLARRYPLAAIEVWNEPNGKGFWRPAPDPARYAELLRATYQTVKAASPTTAVVGGALSDSTSRTGGDIPAKPFLEGMYAAGAAGSMDALSFHPYPHAKDLLDDTFAGIREAREAAGDQATPLWVTESGWTSSGLGSGWPLAWIQTEQSQAERLLALYHRLMSEPDVQVVLFHTLIEPRGDHHTSPGPGYGIVRGDHTPKPAYCAIAALRLGSAPC
jgi:hypothetical protein